MADVAVQVATPVVALCVRGLSGGRRLCPGAEVFGLAFHGRKRFSAGLRAACRRFGLPGLGQSSRAPVPSAASRFFREITVGLGALVRRAISFVPILSEASSTIRARWASPARIDGDRTHEASTSRSRGGTSTLTVNAMNHGPPTMTSSHVISLTEH